jgi:hypothetical protein
MSATLNAAMFAGYFGGCPTAHIPGYTFPVRDAPSPVYSLSESSYKTNRRGGRENDWTAPSGCRSASSSWRTSSRRPATCPRTPAAVRHRRVVTVSGGARRRRWSGVTRGRAPRQAASGGAAVGKGRGRGRAWPTTASATRGARPSAHLSAPLSCTPGASISDQYCQTGDNGGA